MYFEEYIPEKQLISKYNFFAKNTVNNQNDFFLCIGKGRIMA